MNNDEMDELAQVLGEVSGEQVVHGVSITPVTLERLPAFARAARPLVAHLRAMDAAAGEDFWFDLLEQHTDEIAHLLAAGAGVSVESIRQRPMGEIYDLALAVFRANEDFFVRRLLPLLGLAATKASPSAGPVSSSGSAAQDSA